MAENVNVAVIDQEEDDYLDDSLSARFMDWVQNEFVWYAGSFTVHLLLLSLLPPGAGHGWKAEAGRRPVVRGSAGGEDRRRETGRLPEVRHWRRRGYAAHGVGRRPDAREARSCGPQKKNTTTTARSLSTRAARMATGSKDAGVGGAGGFNVIAYGPGAKVTGAGRRRGRPRNRQELGKRRRRHPASAVVEAVIARRWLPQYGGTKHTERAVTGALIWLARHQLADGSWSLQMHQQRCTDKTCTGPGTNKEADQGSGATAPWDFCPFLAAGQTHKTRGSYKVNVAAGINWLVRHQKPDGDLRCGGTMYCHGPGHDCAVRGIRHERRPQCGPSGSGRY